MSFGETEYEYTDQPLFLNESQVQILRDEDGWHLNGTRELLVSAVPLLDRILTTKGVAMIHAATVAYRGRGICIPAWGGTGKTSTIAKLLKQDGFSFMEMTGPFSLPTGACSGTPSRCSSSPIIGRFIPTSSRRSANHWCRRALRGHWGA